MFGALLGGVAGGLLSGIGSGGKGKSLYTPSQKAIAGHLQENVLDALRKGGVDPYSGTVVAPTTANQQTAFDAAGGLLGGPIGHDSDKALRQYLSGAPAYQVDPAQSAALFDNVVGAPARQDFGDALQDLETRYGARYGRSGGLLNAASRAADRFGTGLASERGRWMRADEMDRRQSLERGMDRMGEGIGLSFGRDANTRQNLGALYGLGEAERNIAGEGLSEDYAKWEYSRDWNNPWLGLMGMAMTPEPTTKVPSAGLAAAGGALSGARAGASLFGGGGGGGGSSFWGF